MTIDPRANPEPFFVATPHLERTSRASTEQSWSNFAPVYEPRMFSNALDRPE